jgi:hypothetical protein
MTKVVIGAGDLRSPSLINLDSVVDRHAWRTDEFTHRQSATSTGILAIFKICLCFWIETVRVADVQATGILARRSLIARGKIINLTRAETRCRNLLVGMGGLTLQSAVVSLRTIQLQNFQE